MSKELTTAVKVINKALEGKGVTTDQLERLSRPGFEIMDNELPSSGKFVFDVEKHWAGEGDFAHLRIGVKDSDQSVSVSNLKISAPDADDEIRFRTVENPSSSYDGKKILAGRPLNARLSKYSPVELVAYLNGKNFTAERVKVRQLPFKRGGWENPTVDDVVTKVAYKVTVSN